MQRRHSECCSRAQDSPLGRPASCMEGPRTERADQTERARQGRLPSVQSCRPFLVSQVIFGSNCTVCACQFPFSRVSYKSCALSQHLVGLLIHSEASGCPCVQGPSVRRGHPRLHRVVVAAVNGCAQRLCMLARGARWARLRVTRFVSCAWRLPSCLPTMK